MMNGTQAPKFIYDPTGTSVEILLDYVVITKDEPEEDPIIHQSIFTGHREFILTANVNGENIMRKYWIVEIKMHLYKIAEAIDKSTALAYYEQLKSYEGSELRYFRHRNGDYLKDSSGAEVPMFLESVDEAYYNTKDYKDILYLRFKSTGYVDLTQGIIP